MFLVTRLLVCFFVLMGAFVTPMAAHAATHTVLPGECLYSISRSYGISVDSLASANGIKDSLIFPGQELNIPEESPIPDENPVPAGPTSACSPIGAGNRTTADSPADSPPKDGSPAAAGNQAYSPQNDNPANVYSPEGAANPASIGGLPNAGSLTYIVQPGDSLYRIAQKYSLSYQEIMAANDLESTDIYPGTALSVPGSAGDATASGQSGLQVNRGLNFTRPSPDEVDLLARLITAEADSEPYEGKVAVGAVVLNRLASPGFPKTITDVIYQSGNGIFQFQPVENGWINRPASEEAKIAAREALEGSDPTNGAIYFYATKSKSAWLRARPISKIIGNTIFSY